MTCHPPGKTPAKVLLFELCGESLAEAMAQAGGSMKADDVLHVLRDVADGLLCLHTQKTPVIHGSLEPAHILRDMKTGSWKLGSFGDAKASRNDDSDLEDTASDIWQVGVLILTLLFGSTAFDAKFNNEDARGVHHSILASIPTGRPCSSLEGRICLLACWLLAAQPTKRPTAEQLVIAVASLGRMPAPQLSLAFPSTVRQGFKDMVLGLVRRTIVEAVSSIEGSDRRTLINKFGEEALRDPAKLPAKVKEEALSAQQAQYIRALQTFIGSESNLSPEAKQLGEELAKAGGSKVTEAPKSQAPMDLLDMEEATQTQEAPKAEDPVDLLDMVGAPNVEAEQP